MRPRQVSSSASPTPFTPTPTKRPLAPTAPWRSQRCSSSTARERCGTSWSVPMRGVSPSSSRRFWRCSRRPDFRAFAGQAPDFGARAGVVSSFFAMPLNDEQLRELAELARRGGAPKYHEKNKEQGKLFARERIARLCDEGSFVEDGLLANAAAGDLAA